MGEVWRARDASRGCDVAVKLIGSVAPGLTALQRFQREASLAARIRNPHVVRVLSSGVAAGAPYIVMELLVGESLSSRRERSERLSIEETLTIVAQIADALGAAHDLGIVHRDIKPANVFLATDPGARLSVKVVDFGIARDASGASLELTATGEAIGTPPYMSPEQIMGSRAIDHRADLWALAVVAYELLTGALPFPGASMAAMSVLLAQRRFVPPSALGLGTSFDDWFRRAFAKRPDERFASARELSNAFADAAGEAVRGDAFRRRLEQAPTEELHVQRREGDDDRTRPPIGAGRSSRAVWIVAGALVLGLVAVGAIVIEAEWRAATERSARSPSTNAPSLLDRGSAASVARASAASMLVVRRGSGTTPSDIEAVVEEGYAGLGACIDGPSAPKHAVFRTVRFGIGPDGKPRDVHVVENDPETDAFDACLIEQFRRFAFPPRGSDSTVMSYPLLVSGGPLAPLRDVDCVGTPHCLELGECTAKHDDCVVASDADCARSRECQASGFCHAEGGACVVPTTCDDPLLCTATGRCAAFGGACMARNDADCAKAATCRRFGQCAEHSGRCVASSVDACLTSERCKTEGVCPLGAFACEGVSDAWCGGSVDCTRLGRCTAWTGECAARTEADCKASTECATLGRCTANASGACVAR